MFYYSPCFLFLVGSWVFSVINFFLPVATRKLNGLIGRNDFIEIIDVVDLKIKIEFKDKCCVIDNYGRVEWSGK